MLNVNHYKLYNYYASKINGFLLPKKCIEKFCNCSYGVLRELSFLQDTQSYILHFCIQQGQIMIDEKLLLILSESKQI